MPPGRTAVADLPEVRPDLSTCGRLTLLANELARMDETRRDVTFTMAADHYHQWPGSGTIPDLLDVFEAVVRVTAPS